jgi:hypothetical protein
MFVLMKDWWDPGPGIDMVEVHYTWSLPGKRPDWDQREETQTLQRLASAPAHRACGIEVPREVDGLDRYDLHHFFVYVENGREQVSPIWREEIASREISYEDRHNVHTLVGVRWAIGDWTFSNYTLLELEGLALKLPTYQNPHTPEQGESTGLEFPRIYEFVNSHPLPHVFGGKVHGPRGATVQYHYHLLTLGGPSADQDRETWNTNNDQNWTVTIP